jgi:type II secretory pathway component PulF
MFLVLTFVMIKIVPEFEKIFFEFDLELPAMTQLAVFVSDYFATYLAAPLFTLIVLALLTIAVIALCYMFNVQVLRSFGDRIFRGRRTADVLRILAVATEHHQPIAAAFERMAYVYPSRMLRRQLAPAAAAVAAGGDWRDALADARFVSRAEQSLLKSAEQARNLPWALRTIAARQEKRAVYRLAAAVQVLYPLLIVSLGAVVAFFVIALFIPLVKLVEGLSG